MKILSFFLLSILSTTTLRADDSPLEESMETIGKSFKTIQKQLPDPAQKDSTLALIAKMKKATSTARAETPQSINKIPAKDRPEFLTDYQSSIDELLGFITDLDKAVQANDLPTANKVVTHILESKREGHSTFIKKKSKGAKNDSKEKPEKAEKAEKPEKPEKPEKAEKPSRQEKAD